MGPEPRGPLVSLADRRLALAGGPEIRQAVSLCVDSALYRVVPRFRRRTGSTSPEDALTPSFRAPAAYINGIVQRAEFVHGSQPGTPPPRRDRPSLDAARRHAAVEHHRGHGHRA